MMKILLVFGVILFNWLPSFSQKEFAPIGAEWYYDKNISYNPPILGYTKLTCVKDTVIKNKKVKVIEVLDVINDSTQRISGYEYIYQSGDTIRYWKNNQFNMLYNFAMQNGDSILLYSEMLNQCTENDPYGWNKVDSTFTKAFNGIELKSYTSIPINNSVWGFLEYTSEIFGNTYYLIPQNTNCVNDGIWYGPLRCYSDPEIGFYQFGNIPCDTIFSFIVSGKTNSFLDPSLKWNIGTHCVKEEPIDPYDKWATSFLHTEGDTLMNEKHYKKLISCADSFCVKKSLKSFIREESGKVFLANKTEELLQFDFNLEQGDTLIMDFLQNTERDIRLYIRIDSVKLIAFQDKMERKVQYVTVFDYSNNRLGGYSINDVFVEGIGSLKFGLEYPIRLFITGSIGCKSNLLCFYSGADIVYANPEFNNCYLSTGIQPILQQPELVLVSAANFGILNVQLIKSWSGRLFVFDLNGKLIFRQTVNQTGNQFCLPFNGVYLYRFVSNNGEVQTGKIMVNNRAFDYITRKDSIFQKEMESFFFATENCACQLFTFQSPSGYQPCGC